MSTPNEHLRYPHESQQLPAHFLFATLTPVYKSLSSTWNLIMKNLKKELEDTKSELSAAFTAAQTKDDLEAARVAFLGRKGKIATLMTKIKALSVEEKRVFGPLLNELKMYAQHQYDDGMQILQQKQAQQARLQQQYFDVSSSRYEELNGTHHIYSHIIQQLEDIFISMGYEVADGPEAELDYYNFEALNIPADHPSRELGDTFWLTIPNMLLRTQTSAVQARVMETKKLPLAIFAPGRCYRKEATDVTHDFMFTQAEGLLIDKNISISHLLATAQTFLQAILEKDDIKIRVRPGYFPFVEPGLEIDASCPFCTTGCSVCKKTTWIELLGSGLVHPNVLKTSGINPNEYSGFAFGFGIERIAMIKHGINDIRLFHASATSFLNQFG